MPKWYTKNLESLDYSWLICHPKNEGFFQSFQVNPKLAGDSPLIKHLTLCCPLCWHSIFFSPIVVAYFSSCSPSFIFDFFYFFSIFFSQRFCGRTFITPTRQKLLEIQFERNLKVPAAANPRSTGKPKVTSAVSGGFPRTPPTVYPWNLIGCTWRGGTKKCKK